MRLRYLYESPPPYDMRDEEGNPKEFYRGLHQKSKGQKHLRVPSYTDDRDVANIYASHAQTDKYGSISGAAYTPGARVEKRTIELQNPLDISDYGHTCYFGDFLRKLGYKDTTDSQQPHHDKPHPDGITHDEVMKLLRYLALREWENISSFGPGNKTVATPFRHVILDFENDNHDREWEPNVGDLLRKTPLMLYREEFEWDGSLEMASFLIVDTFALVDWPGLDKVARRMGYDGVIHDDEISGARNVTQDLLDKDVEDIEGIQSGQYQDWEELESDHTHITVRPFGSEKPAAN